MKILDYFLDGLGNYTSKSVTFKIKAFQVNHFTEFHRDLYKSIGSANEVVITPIKNPTAMKVETTYKIFPTVVRTHARH